MYSRLAYTKLFGSFSHSGIRVNDKVGNFYGPLFDIGFQEMALLLISLGDIYEGVGRNRTGIVGNGSVWYNILKQPINPVIPIPLSLIRH